MLNPAPFEVIGAALTVYIAPLATVFPALGVTPTGGWVKIGTSGPLNYADDGVSFDQAQAINFWRSLGDSGSRKAFRTTEDLKIMLTLVDLTLEQYSYAVNSNTVTDMGAYKKIGLSRGLVIATNALLITGPSPYMENGSAQYEIPRVCQSGSPKPVFKRSDPVGLQLEWSALVDPAAASADEYFGRFLAETDDS